MLSRLFSPTLVACINEGRAPQPREVAHLSEQLWTEAFATCRPEDWSRLRGVAADMARVALGGDLGANRP